VKVTVNLTYLI